MANLSDHDLWQLDADWLKKQPETVFRGLLDRALEDLKLARDRLNQGPGNSSRPSGSMPLWQRDVSASKEDEAWQDDPAPEDAPEQVEGQFTPARPQSGGYRGASVHTDAAFTQQGSGADAGVLWAQSLNGLD